MSLFHEWGSLVRTIYFRRPITSVKAYLSLITWLLYFRCRWIYFGVDFSAHIRWCLIAIKFFRTIIYRSRYLSTNTVSYLIATLLSPLVIHVLRFSKRIFFFWPRFNGRFWMIYFQHVNCSLFFYRCLTYLCSTWRDPKPLLIPMAHVL